MLIMPEAIFIHIPRTGGISITSALAASSLHPYVNVDDHRHDYARTIRFRLGTESWNRKFVFSVIRSPWEIVASWYRLAKRDLAAMKTNPDFAALDNAWTRYLRVFEADMDFGAYVKRDILGGIIGVAPGGFWRTWCCAVDGADLGVQPYRFETLQARWREIAVKCGCPAAQLPHANGTKQEPAPWTPELVAAVGELCQEDVARFGFRYTPQEGQTVVVNAACNSGR